MSDRALIPSASRRALLLGTVAGAGSLALGVGPAAATGAPALLTGSGGDGGPAPKRRDARGFPLPDDPDAVPNSKGRAGSGKEQTQRSARGKGSDDGSRTAMSLSGAPNYYAGGFPTLRTGTGFWDTRALQYLLLSAGFKTNWEETYGSSTTSAVRAYQQKVGLPVTGTADPATLEKLTPSTGAGAVSYRVYAIQTLLRKHGYRFFDSSAPDMSTNYGPITTKYVKAFQAGHGIGPATFVGYYTWRTLFAAKSTQPMYPLRQADTGRAQWSNCGPVSAVTLLIYRGITPRGWTWNMDLRTAAVNDFRYRAMGLANTAERDARGTEYPDFQKAFATYGLTTWQGGISDTLADARAGRASIAGGDAYKLPWDNHANGPVSHWMAVLGWDGTYYLAMDPLSTLATNDIHRITESQLRTYASTNPGHPISTAAKNSIMLR
ncbi:peptidoglycan-binding protein [Barrientosiimonas humi]|uniref:peptidoglycan-binding domain-containing protein n=1 Tax=Barrientosiimonas humi TaxID=999931 RepID=UPI00370D4586